MECLTEDVFTIPQKDTKFIMNAKKDKEMEGKEYTRMISSYQQKC